ncbi:hypothetical protein FACS1894170_10360 [Planctomycetales bacterium]|nr:hypothetical protein FACS1894170_10360 [Planctomycetales bacterium]
MDTETTDTTVSEVLDSGEVADSTESEVVIEEIADVILTATLQPLEDNVLISWTNGPADVKFSVVVVDPKGKSKTIKAGKSDHVTYVPQGVVGKYEVTLSTSVGQQLATTVFSL